MVKNQQIWKLKMESSKFRSKGPKKVLLKLSISSSNLVIFDIKYFSQLRLQKRASEKIKFKAHATIQFKSTKKHKFFQQFSLFFM